MFSCVWFLYFLFRVSVVVLMLSVSVCVYELSFCCCSLMFSIVVLFPCLSVLM